MKHWYSHAAAIVTLMFPVVVLATGNEYNWIPAGKIDVGDPESEILLNYWSDSPDASHTGLNFTTGKRLTSLGKAVTQEKCKVGLRSFWNQRAWGTIVVRRLWDTRQGPVTVKVEVDPQVKKEGTAELPAWQIPKFDGNPRWVYLYYVVPREAISNEKKDKQEGQVDPLKGEVTLSFTYDKPTASYEYTLFVTRDWEFLGEEHYGGLSVMLVTMTELIPAVLYRNGIVQIGLADYDSALKEFNTLSSLDNEYGRLARRMIRLVGLKKAIDAQPERVEHTAEAFQEHYRLGLYAAANGFWEEALDQFSKAVEADPENGEATYRLAEAMEYSRMPIKTWAAIFERAGDLFQRDDFNTVDLHIAIQMDKILWQVIDGKERYMCNEFDKGSMEVLHRDWQYVQQLVWGASRGTYKMNYHFKTYHKEDEPWVMQAGWIFGPPDSAVPVRGTYDYTISHAGYGSSHCGGVDCGTAGSGHAQLGPGRGWEVFIHEWNHAFDWTLIAAEIVPGYPVTHSSGSCGKYPQVSMGCGHRSSMYYYITPAQYKRHESSDPELKGNHIKVWKVGALTPLDMPEDLKGEELEKWVVANGDMEQKLLDVLKVQWEKASNPPENQPELLIKSEPEPKQAKTWEEYLFNAWSRGYRILDSVGARTEAQLASRPGSLKGKESASPTDFVDLLRIYPKAPRKAVAHAETYVWSPKDQEVRMWLGFNDGMAVWLNGRRVRRGDYYATAKWADQNRTDMVSSFAELKKGWNHVLCKVERLGGGWGFSVGLVNYDNTPIEGLKYQATKPDGPIAKYVPPEVGKRYNWDEVKDDYQNLLPNLNDEDIKKITGLKEFRKEEDVFLFHVNSSAGPRVIAERDDDDKRLNNYLNWNREAVAAVRYRKDGDYRDLIFIRPEYYEEYLRLLPGDAANNVLGVVSIKSPDGSREYHRLSIVVDSRIEGDYPLDEEGLLAVYGE